MDWHAVRRSARFYFWPIILLNVLAMAYGAGADVPAMVGFAFVIAASSSFGFLANDLCDRRIDLVNAAGHFEAANARTVRAGWSIAWFFAGCAIATAWALGPRAFGIAAGALLLLTAYSPVLRRWLLVPNVVTAALASGPLWAPLLLASSGGRRWQWWLVAGVTVILIAREMLMDARDVQGDAAGGRVTLATRLGAVRSARVAVVITAVAAIPMAMAVVSGTTAARPLAAAASAVLALAIVAVLLRAAALVPRHAAARPVIQRYVEQSRLAMLVVPVLPWLLSVSSVP